MPQRSTRSIRQRMLSEALRRLPHTPRTLISSAMEKDMPLLALRIAPLGKEHRESSRKFAEQVMLHARAELDRLMAQHISEREIGMPEAAD